MSGIIKNPFELGKSYLGQLSNINNFEINPVEEKVLIELDDICTKADINDQKYFTSATKAFSIPVSYSSSEKVSYHEFERLDFEAVFVTYSIIKIGQFVGGNAVRALCVTFNEALLLPCFDYLENDHLLHVPVLAISNMISTD